MIPSHLASLEDGDPLDARLARAHGAVPERGGLGPALTSPHTRTLLLLPLGLALGPSGMNLLSPPVLSFIDPLVSVALAAIGVLLGLALDVRRAAATAAAAAAAVDAGLTVLIVGAGALLVHLLWLTPGDIPWFAAMVVAICAVPSLSPATGATEPHALRLVHVGDLNSILAILVGAGALAGHRAASLPDAALLTGSGALVALALAAAGWLLVVHPASDRERHAFVAGTLLLLAGAAAYLGQSALLMGLVAGVFWGEAGGPAGDRIARDVRYVQHPLVVLLLLVAGAHLTLGLDTLALAVVVFLCRSAAKLVSAAGFDQAAPALRGRVTSDELLAPGIVGLALAVNVLQTGGDHARVAVLLSAVAVGILATDLMLITLGRQGARR
jgi:hypothetical protein